MISSPRMGRITQGTIFCGGHAEEYPGLPVWGVVITARCDTTHEKTPIVNYLPVVTVEEWLLGHGGLLSIEREFSDTRNRFKNLLAKKQLSDSLLEVHGPEEVAEKNFPVPDNANGNKAAKETKDAIEARDLARRMAELGQCLLSPLPNREPVKAAVTGCKKSVEAVVKDLIGHKLAGYYFVPSLGDITEQASKKGYVVLLREVHHIPRRGVSQLVDGIARETSGEPMQGLCFDCFDFVYPIAEMQSPWTEHLMQFFCNLFGRIGVADVDRGLVTEIIGSIEFSD